MKRQLLFATIIPFLITLFSTALAQQSLAYTLTNDMAEYTTVHVIEVGDRPGHILRIFELVWDESANPDPAIFNGVRVIGKVQRAFADYTNSTGSFHGYEEYHLENDDVIYGRYIGTTQTAFDEDGNVVRTSVMAVHELTGGTGVFEGIQGLLRSSLVGEPGPDATFAWSDVTVEGSYWMPDEMAGATR